MKCGWEVGFSGTALSQTDLLKYIKITIDVHLDYGGDHELYHLVEDW
jgi:hypothetical protein